MKTKFFLATAAVAMMGAGLSFADGHVDPAVAGAIKARQGQMQLYAHNLGVLGAMAKGDMDYNAETAQAAADNLLAVSGLNAMTMWPQGSDNSLGNNRASPDIWTNFPDVVTKAGALSTAAGDMAAAAGKDLDGLRAAMGPLGGACGACHKAYRTK